MTKKQTATIQISGACPSTRNGARVVQGPLPSAAVNRFDFVLSLPLLCRGRRESSRILVAAESTAPAYYIILLGVGGTNLA